MQHVSHFSHFGLIAFNLFLLLGRFDNRRSGFVPITVNVVAAAAGHSATGRTVRNPTHTKTVTAMTRRKRDIRTRNNIVFALTWCDGDDGDDGDVYAAVAVAVATHEKSWPDVAACP